VIIFIEVTVVEIEQEPETEANVILRQLDPSPYKTPQASTTEGTQDAGLTAQQACSYAKATEFKQHEEPPH
jgi:hypothetical protein